ncbi:MAG: TonB-dependent receptor [Arenicella sp.]|nr:TonB-dependent receptor [Arenicella sp.]
MNNNNHIKGPGFLKAGVIATLSAVSFTANAAGSGLLEEIIVTAQKRAQNVNDVSIAITAFSGDQLDALGIESSEELIAFSPGVSLAGDIGGQRAIFNIRGVVQNDYADIAEAPVAVYVDGGYLASTQAQTFGVFDIERVEILKGPQGTLFGRNATGGLVNTITAKPTEETEGYVKATGASFDQFRLEGAISGALSDTVRGRLSAFTNQQGEILNNIYEDGAGPDTRLGSVGGGQDGYNDDTVAVRAQLEFDIGKNGSVLLSANIADTTKSEGPYQVVNTTEIKNSNGGVIDVIFAADDPLGCDTIQNGGCIDGNFNGDPFRPVQGGDFNGNFDPDGAGRQVNKDFAFDDQNQIESEGLAVTINYDFGGVELVSITDYKNFERTVGLDSDQTASPELVFQSFGDIDQFSQEFRLSGERDRVKWVTGLYYLNVEADFIQGLAASPTAGFLAGEEVNTIAALKTDSYSIFGQIDYELSDKTVLVGGVRIIREDKSLDGIVFQNANLNDRVIEVDRNGISFGAASFENDQDLWSAKLQFEYTPDDNSLYYIGVNRGVKAGSFNASLFGGFTPYDPEELISYEAGAKLSLADGKIQLNGGIYHYDYTDYQSFSFVNNTSTVSNEQATFTGAEVELFYSPNESWDIILGSSYIDATVEDLEVADGVFRDTTPAFTPEFQASGLVRYNWSLESGGSIAVQLAGSYQSEIFHSTRNFTAHEIESHFKADARISWEDKADVWSAVFYVDNLADSDHGIIGFDVSGFYGTSQISYAKPRVYGLTVQRNF